MTYPKGLSTLECRFDKSLAKGDDLRNVNVAGAGNGG